MQQISAPGSKPGLQRILALLAELNHPQQLLPVAHVAGTNGKGSTSLMIADIISAAGYKVGRFSSPHLHCYEERFTINGEEISPNMLLFYLQQIEKHLFSWPEKDWPTEFEILTAVAFLFFKDEQVDLAVLEVGMGGLYDSTNVVCPLVSVITGIDYDHTEMLGNTIEAIAYNKAGIIKTGVPIVIGPMSAAAEKVVASRAEDLKAPLVKSTDIQVKRIQAPDMQGQVIDLVSCAFTLRQQRLTLQGEFQLHNLACAVAAVEILHGAGLTVQNKDLAKALAQLKLPGRLEVLHTNPLVIGDVAHNPQGAAALSRALQELLPDKYRVLVCGMLDDKERATILQYLGPSSQQAVITRPLGQRNHHWQEAADLWKKQFPTKDVYEIANISAAVKKGLELLNGDEYLLITGSFYVLDEARNYF